MYINGVLASSSGGNFILSADQANTPGSSKTPDGYGTYRKAYSLLFDISKEVRIWSSTNYIFTLQKPVSYASNYVQSSANAKHEPGPRVKVVNGNHSLHLGDHKLDRVSQVHNF
jgi:hypothetical protein